MNMSKKLHIILRWYFPISCWYHEVKCFGRHFSIEKRNQKATCCQWLSYQTTPLHDNDVREQMNVRLFVERAKIDCCLVEKTFPINNRCCCGNGSILSGVNWNVWRNLLSWAWPFGEKCDCGWLLRGFERAVTEKIQRTLALFTPKLYTAYDWSLYAHREKRRGKEVMFTVANIYCDVVLRVRKCVLVTAYGMEWNICVECQLLWLYVHIF